jgi:hypothetical protein
MEDNHPQAYNSTYHAELERRHLADTVDVNSKDILNPVYCIKSGDSFMFQIDDPKHYPVYMR